MDFGDLKDDASIQEKLQNFHDSVEKIDKMLDLALKSNIYENLTTKEKLDYDLFIAYALNTLYWLYLKIRGKDPNGNEVKSQLNRIREYMLKVKEVKDKDLRPRINQQVAQRFVEHSIQYKRDLRGGPSNKRIRFEDD